MEKLKEHLQQLGNAPGNEIWAVLKEAESGLREELVEINKKKELAEEKERQKLEVLRRNKEILKNLKNEVLKTKEEYKQHIDEVKKQFADTGLNLKEITSTFEQILSENTRKQKEQLVDIMKNTFPIANFSLFEENVEKAANILKFNVTSKIHEEVIEEVEKFYHKGTEVYRLALWSHLQKYNIPMKPLSDAVEIPDLPDFFGKLHKICRVASNLEYILNQNNIETNSHIISAFFGLLSNMCIDMIKTENDSEKDNSNFEWIVTCAYKWSRNMKEVVLSAVDGAKLDSKVGSVDNSKVFDKEFVNLVHIIIRNFVEKSSSDPYTFSELDGFLRKFEAEHIDELAGEDLFAPLYQPDTISKLLMLEIEMFSFETSKLFENERCILPLSACSLANIKWASDITIFFEEWITKITQQISNINNSEARLAYYDTALLLIHNYCLRIHTLANRLYMEPSWANDVYLVMNSVWEIRKILETATITWQVTVFDVEKDFENEWNRLGDMITEYLDDILDGLDTAIRVSYASENDKLRKICSTFERIVKCLKNVSKKASESSRSRLLNKLIEHLFEELQTKFNSWQKSSVAILSALYSEIYTNLLGNLEILSVDGIWKKEDGTRKTITQLDALMKVAANRDPSGELVRIAFKSIDEEQVIKMLAELGIKATSDHAFQDYQILAENWDKLRGH